jgi:hypothetical protein
VRSLVLAVCALTMLTALDAAAQCKVYDQAFSSTFRNDANLDLNDYGRIHVDAENPACAEAALYAFTAKLQNHLDNPQGLTLPDPSRPTFQQWLDGYLVSVIFAAAMRIGANGWASHGLDDQLARLEIRFHHYDGDSPPSGPCGGDNLNTCMDDLLGTASGYAWMAAYQARRPNRNTPAQVAATRQLAEQYLVDALSPVTNSTDRSHGVCIRLTPLTTGSGFPLCNGTMLDLTNNQAQTLSVNGLTEMIHYGFGLMTSVASTKIGLEEAGSSFNFMNDHPDQVTVMKRLMEEAQRHVDAANSYHTDDCIERAGSTLVADYDCGRGYTPTMIGVKKFYDDYLGGITSAGPYQSSSVTYPFHLMSSDNDQFSFGRYVIYAEHADQWLQLRPEMMPYDNVDPVGFFDGISPSGVATGWTCDQDKPVGQIKVDFYDDNWNFVGTTWANQASEAAVNNWCGGGTAHRFSLQLPGGTQGTRIHAMGLDYTWIGFTDLTCLQSPQCSW